MRYHVQFARGCTRECDFVGEGYLYLHDTCLVMVGSRQRFRIPMMGMALRNLLCVETYRTVPYAVIQRYTPPSILKQNNHLITYRLPDGQVAKATFGVAKDSGGGKSDLNDRLGEYITTTRGLFLR